MAEGCDYSFSRPSISGLWFAGIQFAGRYFGLGTDDKLAHPAELAALQAMGISVFNLAEQWPNSALQGFGLGTTHAIKVRDDMAAKGVPDNRPVYFAVDFDVTAAQWPKVLDYFYGINSILPLDVIGIYGGVRAMQWAARDGAARWFYQTAAWSYGQVADGVHVYQYSNGHTIGGGDVDLDRSLRDDFGQWGGALVPVAAPTPYAAPQIAGGAAWDYVPDIDGTAGDVGSIAGTVDGYARDLDGLRTF